MSHPPAADLLPDLIRFRTVNPGGDELALCEHLGEALSRRGADDVAVVEVPREASRGGYVYARFGEPEILVNAHVDTVPVNAGWQSDPFEARASGERVYGLGAADTKGAIAAVLAALDRVRPVGVGILFSGDEERTGTCLPAFLASERGRAVRRALVCEPTSRRIGIRHRGVLAYRASVAGSGGHSSRADRMPKPIVTMARLACALDDLGRARAGEGPETMRGLCMNVAEVGGGVAFNVVPDHADLTFSIRPYPGFDRDAFESEVRARAREIDPAIVIENALDHPPLACGDEAALRDLVGPDAGDLTELDFWTEAAILSGSGIESAVVGPGDISQAHAPEEYVEVADLEWATDLFAGVFAGTR